jgi:hypothetical protein
MHQRHLLKCDVQLLKKIMPTALAMGISKCFLQMETVIPAEEISTWVALA